MSTAISIPDDTAKQVIRFAERLGIPPTELCSLALREYLERHDHEGITAKLNAVCAEVVDEPNAFGRRAAKGLAAHVEW